MAQDNKRIINRVKIDNFGYSWAVKMANKYGADLSEFCGSALASLAVAWNSDTGEIEEVEEWDGDRMKLAINHFAHQQRHRSRQMVREVAVIHAQYPDDVSADQLAQMCAIAGMDLLEVLDAANSSEFKSIVDYSKDGSKFGECVMWLADYMTKETQDEERDSVPAAQVFAAAKSNGFEEQMVKRAKQRIKADPLSPSIESRRVSKGWVWYIKQKGDDTPDE